MTLGELIKVLTKAPADYLVIYDNGEDAPGDFASWRGAYRQLTLEPDSTPQTAENLLKKAQDAVGATFQGYKGGNFVMNLDTAVYADPYGVCEYRIITGYFISHLDKDIALDTVKIPWEYT